MDIKPKNFTDSEAVLAQLVMPYQSNAAGNVHGGEIMKLMDSAAGVSAMKHSGKNCVTARVDELCFKKPIHIGEHVICKANVVYAGRTSMEVFVTVESENLTSGKKQIALTAFFTMVALNESGHPSQVPPIEFSLEPYVQKLYIEGQARYFAHRKN